MKFEKLRLHFARLLVYPKYKIVLETPMIKNLKTYLSTTPKEKFERDWEGVKQKPEQKPKVQLNPNYPTCVDFEKWEKNIGPGPEGATFMDWWNNQNPGFKLELNDDGD